MTASALGGKDLVTFEELYDLSDKDEPVKVAEHKDIEDDGQTVSIKERIINIHTRATDPEGEKSIVAGNKVTIIDTVKLDNLEIGTEYQLTGWQMLKEENAELPAYRTQRPPLGIFRQHYLLRCLSADFTELLTEPCLLKFLPVRVLK